MQARMRQACLFAVVVAASVVVFAGTALAQSGNPHLGTWKLNLAKSKYNAGTAPKSTTLKHEAVGASVTVTVDSVAADGTASHFTFTTNYDGKDSPITGNTLNGDTVAVIRVDANTTRTVYKKDGKVTVNQTAVVSADGKTRTITSKGTNTAGRAVDAVIVYDKQ